MGANAGIRHPSVSGIPPWGQHMVKKEQKKYKDMLLAEKARIIGELLRDNEEYHDLKGVEDGGDMADVAFKFYEKNMLIGVSQKEKETLVMIDAALERIDENNYGNCVGCGCEIETQRLDFLPYAIKCVKCKAKEEKAGRFANIEEDVEDVEPDDDYDSEGGEDFEETGILPKRRVAKTARKRSGSV
jgi:RNA polymerase-binding protein DksA